MWYKDTAYPSGKKWNKIHHNVPNDFLWQPDGLLLGKGPATSKIEKT